MIFTNVKKYWEGIYNNGFLYLKAKKYSQSIEKNNNDDSDNHAIIYSPLSGAETQHNITLPFHLAFHNIL